MNRKMELTIKNKSEVIYLKLDDVLYILADGNYCNIYFADGSVLSTLTYQRAEMAKMMDEQLSLENRKKFAMLGRSYLINTDYVLRIQPGRHLLTFRVNCFGTTKKVKIKATANALSKLAEEMGCSKDADEFRTKAINSQCKEMPSGLNA